jgi:hypothetical protein
MITHLREKTKAPDANTDTEENESSQTQKEQGGKLINKGLRQQQHFVHRFLNFSNVCLNGGYAS